MNGICDALRDYTTSHHVLPVSDDGGSTSEIIRVSGGPAVGAFAVGVCVYPTNLREKPSR